VRRIFGCERGSNNMGKKKRNCMTSSLRWGGHVACVEEIRQAHRILVRNLKGKDH
jgi:hypothetical protein